MVDFGVGADEATCRPLRFFTTDVATGAEVLMGGEVGMTEAAEAAFSVADVLSPRLDIRVCTCGIITIAAKAAIIPTTNAAAASFSDRFQLRMAAE